MLRQLPEPTQLFVSYSLTETQPVAAALRSVTAWLTGSRRRSKSLPVAREWAARLAHRPTHAIGMTKTLVNTEWTMDVVSAVEAEAQAQALMMLGADHRAFYQAFKEKRQPEFRGK